MKKNILILVSLVLLPNILAIIYDRQFEYAGNWLEDYANYIKLGLLIISIIATSYLLATNYKNEMLKFRISWLVLESVILALLLVYLYLAVNIINFSLW